MNRQLGSTLIIIGTCVGGGMLGLPIATAHCGFLGAALLLLSAWIFMTVGGLLILEVNLWMPRGTNMIMMAKNTLGRPGQVVMWFIYLALLYALMFAYTSGGSDVLHGLLRHVGITWSLKVTAALFTALLAVVVMAGITVVDYVNRFFMGAKFLFYTGIVIYLTPHIHAAHLWRFHACPLLQALTVIITSFGFGHIIPSIRTYLEDNAVQTRRAILWGSFVPLVMYFIWIAIAQGVLSHAALASLQRALSPVSGLATALSVVSNNAFVTDLSHGFVSICVVTSFLSVALGLSDCLADALHVNKKRSTALLVSALTFLPPLSLVLLDSKSFLLGLRYAGIFCVALLVLLPALMAWQGRYRLALSQSHHFRLMGGKITLAFIMLLSLSVIGAAFIYLM